MPRQPERAQVSKTDAQPEAPPCRPNLQNPNGWQSTSSNRTARKDAPGRPTTPSIDRSEKMHVGIDVSKGHLDVHVHETGLKIRVSNDHEGIEKLIAQLSSLVLERVVLEATATTRMRHLFRSHFPSQAACRRQSRTSCSHRLHAQAPHHPQRNDPGQPTMGRRKSFTADTAAVRSVFAAIALRGGQAAARGLVTLRRERVACCSTA
jgi:hypothetical protein